jgi:beta-xylosidase
VAAGRDDFDLPDLQPDWISLRDRDERHCTTKERAGWLTLHARGGSLDDRDVVFVGRRQHLLSCRTNTLVDAAAGTGGLVVRMDEEHHYEIEATADEVRVIARIGPLRTVVASRTVTAGPLELDVEVAERKTTWDARSGPDTLSFGFAEPGGAFTTLATLDGRYLSTEVAGGFTGRVIGLYATAGTVHFDWSDRAPLDSDPTR